MPSSYRRSINKIKSGIVGSGIVPDKGATVDLARKNSNVIDNHNFKRHQSDDLGNSTFNTLETQLFSKQFDTSESPVIWRKESAISDNKSAVKSSSTHHIIQNKSNMKDTRKEHVRNLAGK